MTIQKVRVDFHVLDARRAATRRSSLLAASQIACTSMLARGVGDLIEALSNIVSIGATRCRARGCPTRVDPEGR